MISVNPNGPAMSPSFSTARRIAERRWAHNGEVYATDADGIQYRFLTVYDAAKACIDNNYCKDRISVVAAKIRLSIKANNNNAASRYKRFAGFEWRDKLKTSDSLT